MIIVLIVLIVAIVSCYCYHQPIVTVRKAINTDHNKKYQKINKIGPQIKMMSSTKNIRTKTYSSIIKQLYEINMYNPVKMGLDNMLQLNQLMGDPLQNTSIVHITGTNGKGSVAWKISSCLKNSNIRTGMFISPHISSFKERIQINGQLIGSKDIVEILPELFSLADAHRIPATFFELTTALAFKQFNRAKCEAVVLEVGLGGRLDSTNIVKDPALCVITSVQLDHMKILGDTVEKIAVEKAGIMKPGVNVLVGPQCPLHVLQSEADRIGATLYTVEDVLSKEERKYQSYDYFKEKNSRRLEVTSERIEDIDNLNSDLALAAMRLLKKPSWKFSDSWGKTSSESKSWNKFDIFKRIPEDIQQKVVSNSILDGLAIKPPCRFQTFRINFDIGGNQINVDIVFDIAHNYDAMICLKMKTMERYSASKIPIRIVLGMSKDKEVDRCLRSIVDLVSDASKIHCTSADHPRAASSEELRLLISSLITVSGDTSLDVSDSSSVRSAVGRAIDSVALDVAKSKGFIGTPKQTLESIREYTERNYDSAADALVLVCGTAFIMSDARAAIGISEPRDSEEVWQDTSDFANVKTFKDGQEYFKDLSESVKN